MLGKCETSGLCSLKFSRGGREGEESIEAEYLLEDIERREHCRIGISFENCSVTGTNHVVIKQILFLFAEEGRTDISFKEVRCTLEKKKSCFVAGEVGISALKLSIVGGRRGKLIERLKLISPLNEAGLSSAISECL